MREKDYQYALLVPTYNAGPLLEQHIKGVERQSVPPAYIKYIDSSSKDGTADMLASRGYPVDKISTAEFNHGATRNELIKSAATESGIRFVVFLTQDAVLNSDFSIEKLLSAFEDPDVGAAYGRQVGHYDASTLETHAREFNYGAESVTKTMTAAKSMGIKTVFISNSFSAYRLSSLESIGLFDEDLILGEDTIAAAKIIMAGGAVKYQADAVVMHSHDYTIRQEFKRYFDIGVMHAENHWLLENFGGASGEGFKFIVSEILFCIKRKDIRSLFRIPLATLAKFIGYKVGRAYRVIPQRFVPSMSMHKRYWEFK